MFAGSGALGAEALSRGASDCIFIEKNPAQAQHLQQSLQAFGCTPTVLVGDSLQLLAQQKTPFDVVFLDPPYGLKLWQSACELLVTHQLIHANSLIYIESDCEWGSLNLPPQWLCLKTTKAGTVHGFLAQYEFNL
jgi:16S rRNA (guanine966-N2)-methyltransferase